MKMGFRTPSPSRSFKARTTGKVNRTIKKAVDPTYGKKGMGYIKDPKRAVYNNIYHKTTVGVGDLIENGSSAAPVPENNNANSGISEFHDKAGVRICPSCKGIFPGRLVCPVCGVYLLDYTAAADNRKQGRKRHLAYTLIAVLIFIMICIIKICSSV